MVARNLSLILQKPDKKSQHKNSFRNKITIKKDGIIVEVRFVIKTQYKDNNRLKIHVYLVH
jgi:hypothetical protein